MTSLFHLKKYDWKEGRKEGGGNARVNFALPEKRKTLGPQLSRGFIILLP
jgi:hypothetical protein